MQTVQTAADQQHYYRSAILVQDESGNVQALRTWQPAHWVLKQLEDNRRKYMTVNGSRIEKSRVIGYGTPKGIEAFEPIKKGPHFADESL